MNDSVLSYVPRHFTGKAVLVYIIVLVFCLVVFPSKLPLLWITFGLLGVILFFYYLNVVSVRWAGIPDKLFRKKLFCTSLIIRLVYVLAIYLFYTAMYGNPFEYEAADSIGYHGEAVWILDLIHSGQLNYYFTGYKLGYSDSGYPLFLSFIYLVSAKSILVARLVNAFLGAWMVVLIYRLAQRNFGETAARISAIMAMLLPTLIYYTGLHLKETTMVFLLVAFAERTDLLLRSPRIRGGLILQVILLGASLFLFRTVLAVAAWFALFTALLFSANRVIGVNRKVIFAAWFAIAALFIFSGRILNEIQYYAEARFTNQEAQMKNYATREEKNTLATYGKTAIFIPLMVVAPFPTMVKIEEQENALMINGAVFTHNVYAFFVVLALLALYKKKMLSLHLLILALLGGYLLILSMSGFALSERFHLPTVPFLVILAGYGITQINMRNRSWFVPYLVLVAIIILAWNWFKLAGRGMI